MTWNFDYDAIGSFLRRRAYFLSHYVVVVLLFSYQISFHTKFHNKLLGLVGRSHSMSCNSQTWDIETNEGFIYPQQKETA